MFLTRSVSPVTHYWCQKVLPLVYDNSLSYYEVLCKLTDAMNNIIQEDVSFVNDINELKQAVQEMQEFIDNLDTSYVSSLIEKYIASMIFLEITDAGYIVYHIPRQWSNIQFRTTGLDFVTEKQPEYGHLVLLY